MIVAAFIANLLATFAAILAGNGSVSASGKFVQPTAKTAVVSDSSPRPETSGEPPAVPSETLATCLRPEPGQDLVATAGAVEDDEQENGFLIAEHRRQLRTMRGRKRLARKQAFARSLEREIRLCRAEIHLLRTSPGGKTH